jgi:tetratricopeptide (TPR) repeat protein
MTLLKTVFVSLTTVSVLTLSPLMLDGAAHANQVDNGNTSNAFLSRAAVDDSSIQNLRLFDKSALPLRGERYLGSSRTATFYYKKGVKSFEKGNLDKAIRHFEAVLRADGSRGLDRATLHYLANITNQQGDAQATKKYVEAYNALNQK